MVIGWMEKNKKEFSIAAKTTVKFYSNILFFLIDVN